MDFCFWFPGVTLELVASAMLSNWSALTVILHISRELWSSSRAQFHSILMTSWSCPHMAWWLLPIHLSWASDQRLPLSRLQEVCTSSCTSCGQFWWLPHLCLSKWDNCQRLTPYQSQPCSFWMCMSQIRSHCAWHCSHHPDPWYSSRLPPTVLSYRISGGFSWTGRGNGRFLPCGSELGLNSDAIVGISSLPCAELCSLLASTSWESKWVLLSQWLPSELLEEWSHFFCVGWQWTQQMGAQLGECQQRGYLVREALEEVEFQFDELDCLRGPEPVSLLTWVQ